MMPLPNGIWPILSTPFTDTDRVDLDGLASLVDFYKEAGVSGLLALGQASEVLALHDDERFLVAEHVATLCKGELPLVVVGNFGRTLAEQASSLSRVAAFGADAAVVGLSLLPSAERMDEQLLELAEQVDGIPLGIYELPEPEHRLLSPEQVARVARSGRFYFMKDTCRQAEPFIAKLKAAQGTKLKLFQANLRVLPESMAAGSHGFCGWMPMVAPELCAQLIHTGTPPEIKRLAYEKLMAFQTVMVAQGFPASAKYLLMKRGVKIHAHSRVASARPFSSEGAAILDRTIETEDPFALIPTPDS